MKDVLEKLQSVLCDPEGKASIRGSEADLAIIDEALTQLREIVSFGENRDIACQLLAEHLIEERAAECEIPFPRNGEDFVVKVSRPERKPVGMYGETPRVKIGSGCSVAPC